MSDGGAAAIIEFGRLFTPLLKRAFLVALTTSLGLAVLTCIMLYVNWSVSVVSGTKNGWLAVASTLLVFLLGGLMLAIKRTLSYAVAEAFRGFDISAKLLNLIFTKMLQVEDEQTHAERGRVAARASENLPLRQAEERLKAATQSLLKAPEKSRGLSGKLSRKILSLLIEKIEAVTLQEFRQEDQKGDGINLTLVKERLGQEVNARALKLIHATSQKTTLLFGLALVLGSYLLSLGIAKLPL